MRPAQSFAPELDPQPRRAIARARSSAYEGASHSNRTLRWRAPTSSPNAGVLGNLATLRDRSREAVRNNGYAKGIIDRLVTNIIGTGIKPQSLADDKAFATELNALWTRWTDESDADGLCDFYGQQALVARAWLEGGEAFGRLRYRQPKDGLSVPLQVQVLEPELCPHTHVSAQPNGNRVRAGIEFNKIGRREAYWFHPFRPDHFQEYDTSQLRRIVAPDVAHVFLQLRPGQLRGIPQLTTSLIRLHQLDGVDDAVVLRMHMANLFAGFITRPAKNDAEADLHPLTGQTVEPDDEPTPLQFEPGILQELDEGEEMTFSEPPDVSTDFGAFMRHQLRNACAAADIPYEVATGDLGSLNDRVMRVLLNEFRRQIAMWQHQVIVFQFCRWVWKAFMDRVLLSGALPIPLDYLRNAEPWARVKWVPQGWPYLHPVQDVDAQRAAVRAGFTSRSTVVSEQGEDSEVIDQEQAEDNARADGLGLNYESDGRKALKTGAAEGSESQQRENDGGTSGEGDDPPPPPQRYAQ